MTINHPLTKCRFSVLVIRPIIPKKLLDDSCVHHREAFGQPRPTFRRVEIKLAERYAATAALDTLVRGLISRRATVAQG